MVFASLEEIRQTFRRPAVGAASAIL
jgi:hypothetical protein